MDGQLELEEPEQRQWDPKEEEDDNESMDFVRIDQSEKDNSDQETSDQEEDHDQDQEHHHLVEGTDGGGGEHQQERNLTDWSFDGTMDSSAGGQSVAAAELVNLRMAALTAKNHLLEEQLKNAQLQAQIVENAAKYKLLEEKNKTLESQLKSMTSMPPMLPMSSMPTLPRMPQMLQMPSMFRMPLMPTLPPLPRMPSMPSMMPMSSIPRMPQMLQMPRMPPTPSMTSPMMGMESPPRIVLLPVKPGLQIPPGFIPPHLVDRIPPNTIPAVFVSGPNGPMPVPLGNIPMGMMEEINKTQGRQLYNMGIHEKALEKIELHIPHGNQWNLAASSPKFTMNSDGSIIANGIGGDEPVKWHHAFALKGFPLLDVIRKKEEPNNVNNNKTTVFYYEVRIVDQQISMSSGTYLEDFHKHVVGLSTEYNKDFGNHVGRYPFSYGFDEFGEAYYANRKVYHTVDDKSAPVDGYNDIYGFGLLVKPNKELAIFATINGELVDRQIPIKLWSEFVYPTVSLSKKTTKVEANFGTMPFRYDIANCPGLQLE